VTVIVANAQQLAAPSIVKEEAANHTVFDQILATNLPAEEKKAGRLVQEGTLLMVGATLSTAWSMSVAVYCLIKHPEVLRKLKAELEAYFPQGPATPLDLPTLEQMKYLQAVINEALRIGIAVSHRSARISEKPLLFTDPGSGKQWMIPAGTPMSMSHPLLMRDETIFPEPTRFRPERWIEDPSLERYQFAFSKGTRGCIGTNLAWTEMRLIITNVFTQYGTREAQGKWDRGLLELFETDDRDVECEADGGIVMGREGSKGIRVRIQDQ
jgi:cytochrome P450